MSYRVVKAATVITVRRRPVGAAQEGRRESISQEEVQSLGFDDDSSMIRSLFAMQGGTMRFNSPWEVLMGQGECRNYFKADDAESVSVMRYPGEYKFPGGSKDEEDPTLQDTAVREFEEEFLTEVPPSATLSLFNVKQTKAVQGTSHVMFNYLALQDDNAWLADVSVDRINADLAERRERFAVSLASGEFFGLSTEEKSVLSPEVHSVVWLSLAEAVWFSITSKASTPTLYINDFQRREFEELGISRRDPMYVPLTAYSRRTLTV
jgi:8-oxo-dGTP pyrophosphatase MutT (NUDIX family)